MIIELAYFSLFGKPLIFHLGILTYILFVLTAILGILKRRGIQIVPFQWHPKIAYSALIIATIHGLFGLAIYFNF